RGARRSEGFCEVECPFEFQRVLRLAPRGVVEVLQAARGVSTRGLNVPAGIRTDPHVLARGRYDEILDPLGILYLIAARVDVAEAVLTRQPVEPRFRRIAAAYLHIHPPCRGRSQFTGNWAGR